MHHDGISGSRWQVEEITEISGVFLVHRSHGSVVKSHQNQLTPSHPLLSFHSCSLSSVDSAFTLSLLIEHRSSPGNPQIDVWRIQPSSSCKLVYTEENIYCLSWKGYLGRWSRTSEMVPLTLSGIAFLLEDEDGYQDCRLLFHQFSSHMVEILLCPSSRSSPPYLIALVYVPENTFISTISFMLPSLWSGEWLGLDNMLISGAGGRGSSFLRMYGLRIGRRLWHERKLVLLPKGKEGMPGRQKQWVCIVKSFQCRDVHCFQDVQDPWTFYNQERISDSLKLSENKKSSSCVKCFSFQGEDHGSYQLLSYKPLIDSLHFFRWENWELGNSRWLALQDTLSSTCQQPQGFLAGHYPLDIMLKIGCPDQIHLGNTLHSITSRDSQALRHIRSSEKSYPKEICLTLRNPKIYLNTSPSHHESPVTHFGKLCCRTLSLL